MFIFEKHLIPIRMKNTEYFAYLDNCLIDNNGFKSSYGVTAYTKRDAQRVLSKAKLYYTGSYKLDSSRFRITAK